MLIGSDESVSERTRVVSRMLALAAISSAPSIMHIIVENDYWGVPSVPLNRRNGTCMRVALGLCVVRYLSKASWYDQAREVGLRVHSPRFNLLWYDRSIPFVYIHIHTHIVETINSIYGKHCILNPSPPPPSPLKDVKATHPSVPEV